MNCEKNAIFNLGEGKEERIKRNQPLNKRFFIV